MSGEAPPSGRLIDDLRRRAVDRWARLPGPWSPSRGPSVIGADERVDLAMTVNGSSVRLQVSTRLTLADALRDHLGLTGTHLGCEHGVCGMCTVLVSGEAARSCLLFAAQLEGADVVTVEGLGSPDDQHPLQEAFAHHHALQCGFCTPGFLMSAYDLLAHRPDVTSDDLPEELSGVLCRCTGYRNILAAVADVAADHRSGVPPPRNCAPRRTVGRTGLVVTGPLQGPIDRDDMDGGPSGGSNGTGSGTDLAGGGASDDGEVTVPQREPTLVVDVDSELDASVEQVWAVMNDIDLLARCLPGAELTEHLGDDRYRCRARVGLGAVRLSFAGLAQVTERDPDAHQLAVRARGADAAAGQTQAVIHLVAEPAGEGSGTRVRANARVWLSGRIAQFGRALAGDVSHRMFEQFAVALDEAATTGQIAPTTTRMPSALSLAAGAAGRHVRSLWRRARAGYRRRG